MTDNSQILANLDPLIKRIELHSKLHMNYILTPDESKILAGILSGLRELIRIDFEIIDELKSKN